jgi:hypothetical protein
MFGFVKSHASHVTSTLLLCLCAIAVASCGGGSSDATATSTSHPAGIATGVPTARGGLVTVGVEAFTTPGATPPPPGGTVPPDCEMAVPTSEIAALVNQSLTVLPGRPVLSDGGTILVCRYLVGKDAPQDHSILLTLSGYATEATAISQDAGFRAAVTAQGGVFTKATGLGDDGYTFDFPALTGVSARLGTHVLSLGVGKSISPQPASEAVATVAQRILANVGR